MNVCNVCVNITDMIMPTPAYSHLIHCSRSAETLCCWSPPWLRRMCSENYTTENYFKTHLLVVFERTAAIAIAIHIFAAALRWNLYVDS